MKTVKSVKAWAYCYKEDVDGLFHWALASKKLLEEEEVYCRPLVKPVCVMMVPIGEYRKLIKKAKGKKVRGKNVK